MDGRIYLSIALMLTLTGCFNDFSETIDRSSDGSIQDLELTLVTDSTQYLYAPSGEQFRDARSEDPDVVTVEEIGDERLLLRSHGPGTASILFITDITGSFRDEVQIDVTTPSRIDWEHEPDWVAVTGPFAVRYSLLDEDDVRLEGAGFKAITLAEGLTVRETPREAGESRALFTHQRSRILEVDEGAPGLFTLHAALGDDIELERFEPDDVEDIRVTAPSEAVVGDSSSIRIHAFVGERPVLGFDHFVTKQKSGAVCQVGSDTRSTVQYGVSLVMKRAGTCEVLLKSKQNDWEQRVRFPVYES